MRIFIICTVRKASPEYLAHLEKYVLMLERQGHVVHLPQRDTDQSARGLDINLQNREAISRADEIHVFYQPQSQGTHFDLGVSFALGKKLVVVENTPYEQGKCYSRIIDHWAKEGIPPIYSNIN